MSDSRPDDPPSAFVVRWSADLAPRLPTPKRALDLAMGRGRHSEVLAGAGYRVFGVDLRIEAVRRAGARAARHGFVLRGWVADLTQYPLPPDRFELIVVARYLQRDLFPALRAALVPGGAILYETFTEAQLALGFGPKSPDHLLAEGELRARFDGFDVMFYEEVSRAEPGGAVARIVARRPG
jgi:tellurite methyltransferase